MDRWDNKETPRRRFNPLPQGTIYLGIAVFLGISLGFYLFGLK